MRLAEWAATVPVPTGDGAGEPWRVVPWQRRLFAAVERRDVQVIAATCARGNGKTAVASLIARAFLPGGPLYASGVEVAVVSATHAQARLIVEDIEAWRGKGWHVANSPQMARVKAGGALVRCIAARPQSLHGLRPVLVIADELAQWQQPDRMYAALRTSLGKRPGSRLLAIGTRPEAGSGHVFDKLLTGGADVSLSYAATEADAKAGRLGWRRTWRKANPSLDVLPSLEEAIRAEWREARADDQAMARFKALRLNMGTADTAESLVIDPNTWRRCEADTLPPATDGYALGIDLGSGAAMTAGAAYFPATGRLEAVACFGTPPDLTQRGRQDQVGGLYSRMADRGELLTQPRRVPDVGVFLRACLAKWGAPACIVADRWREHELRDALEAAGVPLVPLALRGQGFKDGGQDVRAFRRAVLGGRVRAPRSLLMRAAFAEARAARDPAGNEKLAKGTEGGRRRRARDDVAAAVILAVAEGSRSYRAPDPLEALAGALKTAREAVDRAASRPGVKVFGPGARRGA